MVPRILDAAERLFGQSDSLNVSIRDIAAEAGMPHPRIYRYFKSKDDVFRHVLQRGRERQYVYEQERGASGGGSAGTLDWVMTENRGYALAVARAALDGSTPSSVGLDASQQVARRSTRLLAGDDRPFDLRDDHAPEVVMAAAMALTIGWVACEAWIVESAALEDLDRKRLRAEIDDLMLSLMSGK
jgi:AcrR family transcriptional regulator